VLTTVVSQFEGFKQLIGLGIVGKKIVEDMWKLGSKELK
jgi:hypothetical protein